MTKWRMGGSVAILVSGPRGEPAPPAPGVKGNQEEAGGGMTVAKNIPPDPAVGII